MNYLSSFQRAVLLQKLSSQTFDLLIIGGGITGAGIALDAASRGLKTALIEKQDFAAGTSSRSTKLIHGGLRYLKNFEFGLVMEVAKERKIIFRNAPHLVNREKLLLPLIKNGSFGKFMTSIGLTFYDLLAQVNSSEWHKMLSVEETLIEEPLLKSDILLGSGFYSEYRSDDARLTIEVIKTAAKYGALPVNYFEAKEFLFDENKIAGMECVDIFSGNKFIVKARQIVNASGPWVDVVRRMEEGGEKMDEERQLAGAVGSKWKREEGKGKRENGEGKNKRLHLTKGVHIVIPRERFPLNHSVYFDVKDGRMIFAIPRGKTTYIGTTDTDYTGILENPVVSKKDVDYLLEATNRIFPLVNLEIADIISSWAGLRPLIHEEGKSPSELSRKDEIFISESGLISIAGGKLSGYRKMAEKVVNMLSKKFKNSSSCITVGIIINGGEFESPPEVFSYINLIAEKIKAYGLAKNTAEYLVNMYGKQSDEILKKFFELSAVSTQKDGQDLLALSELWFAVNNESIHKAQDFFVRRTGKLLFEPHSVPKLLPVILEEMKKYFNWSEERVVAEKKEMENLVKQSISFP